MTTDPSGTSTAGAARALAPVLARASTRVLAREGARGGACASGLRVRRQRCARGGCASAHLAPEPGARPGSPWAEHPLHLHVLRPHRRPERRTHVPRAASHVLVEARGFQRGRARGAPRRRLGQQRLALRSILSPWRRRLLRQLGGAALLRLHAPPGVAGGTGGSGLVILD